MTPAKFLAHEGSMAKAAYRQPGKTKRVGAGLYYIAIDSVLYEVVRVAVWHGFVWTWRGYGARCGHDSFATKKAAIAALVDYHRGH